MNAALKRCVHLAAYALFALSGIVPAAAMNVQPLVLDMVAVGPNATGQFKSSTIAPRPSPVEVVVKKLDFSLDGKSIESPAGDEFLIFPPQAVVPAGATQSFRVQWVGAPDIQKSQTYMISVSQIPVKRKAGESGVQIVFNFGVIVSVAPAGAQSGLKS